MTKALYRKWRPQEWDEVQAQAHVIQTLKNAIINGRVGHAYLFAGPRGTGKTTTARLLAKAVNCLDANLANRPCNKCDHCVAINAGRYLDLIEIDAASNTSVDDVRDLREKINFSPSQGQYKVYIIDEVHMLSTAAFNALLKTLEEPPPHAIFVLATTEIHKIPATVLSRCQRHEFRRIPVKEIVTFLKGKSIEENLVVDEPVFFEVARQATGSLRDAISLLDQLTSTGEHITLNQAQNVLGTATSLQVIEVIDALIERNSAKGLTLIDDALDSGTDSRQFARQIVTYLRNVLLTKLGADQQMDPGNSLEEKKFDHAQQFSMPSLLMAIEAFNRAASQEQSNWHPGLGLELAFTSFLIEPSQTPTLKHTELTPNAAQLTANEKLEEPQAQSVKSVAQKKESPPATQDSISLAPQPPEKQRDAVEDLNLAESHIDKTPTLGNETEEISISKIKQAWGKIRSAVKSHNPRTDGLLNSSKITGFKDNTLILGFQSSTLKEMMEKEANITLTMDVLEEILGKPLLIKCIVTTQESANLPENLNIDKDGMVSTATRNLGGKISRIKEE